KTKKVEELTADEKVIRDAMTALRAALSESEQLQKGFIEKRQELKADLGGKGVFIGSVATALGDLVQTSLHARCPGVVVHGVIANSIIQRNFLTTAPRWVVILLTLVFGLVTTAVTSRMEPIRAVPVLLAIAVGYFAINGILLFGRFHLIVDAA